MKYAFLFLFLFLFLIPFVSANAGTYKAGSAVTINVPCVNNNSYCSASSKCNITIFSPNSIAVANNTAMINAGSYHYYILPSDKTAVLGDYPMDYVCADGGNSAHGDDTFTITSSGNITQNFWDNSTIIIILIIAFVLFGFAVALKNLYFSFISGAMFSLLGVYTIIYGFNEITNLYTRGLGTAFFAMGLYLIIVSAYEEVWGDTEHTGEEVVEYEERE